MFYFITYQCRRPWKDTVLQNAVININPIQWIIDCNKQYGDRGEEYILCWAVLITEDEYNHFKDHL